MSRAIFNCLAGGTVTLDAADTGSNKVLIIPAADGTLLYDDGTGTQTFDNLVVSGNALLFSGQVTTTPSSALDIANKAYVDDSIIADAYTAGTGLTLTGHEFKITDTAVTAGTYGTAARNMTLAVNARGQITSVFDQPIDIDATQVTSGILDAARLSGSYTGITTVGTLTGLTVSTAIVGSITGNAGSATNIAGGLSGSMPYQTAAGATALLPKGTDGQVLSLDLGLPKWISVSGAGTVTSVDGSGGTTGLTLTGGPITSSGTLTLGGTLAVANGGTGATTLTGYVKGNGTSAMTASATIPTTDLSGTISNAQLANSAITINGTSTSLGGSISVGTVTSVTGTAPVVSSGGATPAISMPAATTSVDGYLTSTDWNTFNGKGTVTAVSVVSANGFTGSSSGGATPALTLTTSITGVLKGNGTALSAASAGSDYVAPATATNFTAQQYFGNVALTDAATVAWAANAAQTATFTFVSTNRTMGAPTGLVDGAFYALAVIQNGGSNTLTWNSVFKWAGGVAPTLSTAAAAKDYFVFRSDGTNLYQQGQSLAVA